MNNKKSYTKQNKYTNELPLVPIFNNVLNQRGTIVNDKLYKMIQANKKFSINTEGVIVSNKLNTIQKLRKGGKYYEVQIFLEYLDIEHKKKLCLRMLLHRILYLTFSEDIPPNYYKMHVDHINDTKMDNNDCYINSIDNLCMITASENASKSNKKGQVSKNQMIPVIAKNLESGEEFKFISMSEAARQLSLSQRKISENISSKKKRPTIKGFEFRKCDDFMKTQIIKLNEIFKSFIEGTKYQVSNYGRVKNVIGGISFGNKTRDGYMFITPCINKKANVLRIHRLVASVFLSEQLTEYKKKYGQFYKYVVNHKDCIRSHNCMNNLEILTTKENLQTNKMGLDIKSFASVCEFCKFIRYN